MKHVRKAVLAASAFTAAVLFSPGWSQQDGISLSIESAQARVGRPLTPVSVAGVARRQTRRAAYGYGAGVVGAGVGAAAIGTAAAVSATQPWGWGGGPYAGTGYYGGGRLAARAAYYGSYGSYGAGYYGGGPLAARAAYGGGYGSSGVGSYCTPGTLYIAADGLVQACK